MATYVKYEIVPENIGNKVYDFFGTTDTWKVAIATDAPTVSTDTTVSDITQIGGSNGYTTGGTNATFNSTRSGGTLTATGTDIVWTASGGNLGASTTGRYFILYDDTPSSPADPLWSYWDYGATFTVATGETMTWDTGASIFTFA
jgi:hypothetical protein